MAVTLSMVLQHALSESPPAAPESEPLRGALLKLFAAFPALSDATAAFPIRPYQRDASDELSPAFRVIVRAIALRKAVRLRYRSLTERPRWRRIHPYGLFRHDGVAYLAARAVEKDRVQTYRISRVTAARFTRPAAGADFAVPADFRLDELAARRSWELSGRTSVPGRVRIGPPESLWFAENWQPAKEVRRDGDAAVFETGVRDSEAFARFWLRHRDFEIVSPPDARRAVAQRAAGAAAVHGREIPPALGHRAGRMLARKTRDAPGRKHTAPDPALRLKRITLMVPYILSRQGRDGVPLEELARSFDSTADDMRRELDLLTMCGLPDYGPDRLITWDPAARAQGRVRLETAEYLKRPLRFDRDEAVALLAAIARSRAIFADALPAPLAALASRVRSLLPPALRRTELAAASTAPPSLRAKLKMLVSAARRGQPVAFEYLKLEEGERSERRALPMLLRPSRAGWHLFARDLDRGAMRSFRLDCIRTLRPARGTVTPGQSEPASRSAPGRAVLLVNPSLREWLADRLGALTVLKEADGKLLALVPSYSSEWLASRVLPVAPDAEVLVPADARAAVLRRALAIASRHLGN